MNYFFDDEYKNVYTNEEKDKVRSHLKDLESQSCLYFHEYKKFDEKLSEEEGLIKFYKGTGYKFEL